MHCIAHAQAVPAIHNHAHFDDDEDMLPRFTTLNDCWLTVTTDTKHSLLCTANTTYSMQCIRSVGFAGSSRLERAPVTVCSKVMSATGTWPTNRLLAVCLQ